MGENSARQIATEMMGYEFEYEIPFNKLGKWNNLVNELISE